MLTLFGAASTVWHSRSIVTAYKTLDTGYIVSIFYAIRYSLLPVQRPEAERVGVPGPKASGGDGRAYAGYGLAGTEDGRRALPPGPAGGVDGNLYGLRCLGPSAGASRMRFGVLWRSDRDDSHSQSAMNSDQAPLAPTGSSRRSRALIASLRCSDAQSEGSVERPGLRGSGTCERQRSSVCRTRTPDEEARPAGEGPLPQHAPAGGSTGYGPAQAPKRVREDAFKYQP